MDESNRTSLSAFVKAKYGNSFASAGVQADISQRVWQVKGMLDTWALTKAPAGITNKGAFLWQKFPKFVLGFLLLSVLASLQTPAGAPLIFKSAQLASIGNLSRWAFLSSSPPSTSRRRDARRVR